MEGTAGLQFEACMKGKAVLRLRSIQTGKAPHRMRLLQNSWSTDRDPFRMNSELKLIDFSYVAQL